jgi:N-acetylglucosaminyldiphosphoundecaprenol N-acetyl-beta-D-mannosaminyltransferase
MESLSSNPTVTAPDFPTIQVLGTPLAATDYPGAVARVKAWAAEGPPRKAHLVAAANTHVVTLARHESRFAQALAAFELILPDGMPLVWVMNRSLAAPLADRVYGPTFMLHCLEATQGEPWSHFFVGGSEELLAELRAKLSARFPRLRIAGSDAPPFGPWSAEEDERIVACIRESGAQFVWIGLGCPKQELWLAAQRSRLPPAVYVAVGAAFAFHAGRVRQAPLWMQGAGLEWLFRLVTEPRRLWRRYLVHNSLFLWYLLRDGVCAKTTRSV